MLEIVAFGCDDNNHEGGEVTLLIPQSMIAQLCSLNKDYTYEMNKWRYKDYRGPPQQINVSGFLTFMRFLTQNCVHP